MEISSASSSANSALIASLQSQVRTRQPEQDQQARQSQQSQQAQQTQDAQRTQQAQQTRSVDENESASRSRAEAEGNRPTVNTSGQIVGTRVNTTA